jgi:hypothetical protein
LSRETENNPSEIAKRLADWRAEAERWVEDTCHRAVSRLKSVLVEEIRHLSRRVERMHELLDQLEHMVEKPRDDTADATQPSEDAESRSTRTAPSADQQ